MNLCEADSPHSPLMLFFKSHHFTAYLISSCYCVLIAWLTYHFISRWWCQKETASKRSIFIVQYRLSLPPYYGIRKLPFLASDTHLIHHHYSQVQPRHLGIILSTRFSDTIIQTAVRCKVGGLQGLVPHSVSS